MCIKKIAGVVLLGSMFLLGCGETEVPKTPHIVANPELVSQIDSTSVGDILVSNDGALCQVRYKFKKDRELDCGDGVPLWGTPEYYAKHFVRAVKKSDPEYKILVRKISKQYQ